MPSRQLAPEDADASVVEFRHGAATLVAESFGGGERTFVLVHGVGMGRSVFVDLARQLNGRVIGIDLPGFGESPEPDHVLGMGEHADLVAAYLQAHRIQGAVIIGHSMGSQVAMELALRAPDCVLALVLGAPSADPAARTVFGQARRMVWDVLHERPIVIARGAREYLRGGPRVLPKIRAMLDHRPEDLAPEIRVPALVVRGEKDGVAPAAWCRALTALLPEGRYAELPGLRHETMIRDAEPTVELIDAFLGES